MTPREPDRFDKQAYEARMRCEHDPLICGACLAAALRAAESSALERAAQTVEKRAALYDAEMANSLRVAASYIRDMIALIPPAAAPAAETYRGLCGTCNGAGFDAGGAPCRTCGGNGLLKPLRPAPAAETGEAQGADLTSEEIWRRGYREGWFCSRDDAASSHPVGFAEPPPDYPYIGVNAIPRAAPPEGEGKT